MNTWRMAVGATVAAWVMFAPPAAAQDEARPSMLEQMRTEAGNLRPLVESELANNFLTAVEDLPAIEGERVVYFKRSDRSALSEEDAMALSEDERAEYQRMELGERFHYQTFYGTPLAYVRAIDLAAGAGFVDADGARVFDFGFGGIGHLRLLASLGADTVGVEVLELLDEYYVESDMGAIERAEVAGEGDEGSITLLYGQWPAEADLVEAAGGGFDLMMSKNTLKKGYIHPEREVDPRMLVHLGVSDEAYAQAMFDSLAPGGLFVIYNLYPPPRGEDEPYQPWRSGECPFERDLLEDVGFEVVAFDVDDTSFSHEMAHALGWDAGERAMDLESSLRAMYTILKRPK